MLSKRFIFLFIIALVTVIQVRAQTPAAPETPPKTEQQKREAAQEKLDAQAFELLDAVMKDAERLTLPENRIYISISVADLLWPHDEQAARALFKNAMADLRGILSSALDEGEQGRAYRQKMERSEMRQKLLFALARHDARMARTFMNETRPSASDKTESPGDNEDELEINLAMIIASHDPAQALEMAQKSLTKGFTFSLPGLAAEIQKKDPEGAAKFASDILTKLKSANLTTNQEAVFVAVRTLQLATEPQKDKAKAADKNAQPLLNESSLRELAEMVASAALNSSAEFVERYIDVQSLLPQFEKYAPARAQQLRRKLAQPNAEGESESQVWRRYHELSESGTPEQLLEAAEKASPGMRESLYQQAASKLAKDDKGDRARQIINERITDPQQRQHMLAELDKQILAGAAEKGKLDETRKYLAGARTNEERIAALTQLATALGQKGEKKLALQLLDEARTLSPSRPRYSRQLFAQMLIARAYASLDATQSLAMLEPSIDQLNELLAAGILLGEFFAEEEVVRDDELLIQPVSRMVETFQQQYGKDIAQLARADFARTRDAANTFQRLEVRLLARLAVAQSVLTEKTDGTEEEALKKNSKP